MKDSLRSASGEGAVFDREEIGDLTARVEVLRSEMAAQLEHPQGPQDDGSAARVSLRGAFESARTDVDALLTRLGHDPDDIARWQDKRQREL